jgi:DNA repair protein SbcD/Mre11
MTPFRFIHCSDLHIDSPFKGLGGVRPELAATLREATYKSFQNIVALALHEKVAAVIIAGDVYDLQAQFRFRHGLQELSNAGIEVFVAHGNHDPLDGWSASLKWPEQVHVFSGKEPERIPIAQNGIEIAQIHGCSFPTRDVKENLALKFDPGQHAGFSIAVLHANVGGNTGHENYAPCTLEDLIRKGFDYWALGHVHSHQILRAERPAVVYPGNTQARHSRESGAKGCCLVELTHDSAPDIRFIPMDALRYVVSRLNLESALDLDSATEKIQAHCEGLSVEAEDRPVLIRLSLEGRTPINHELRKPGAFDDFADELQTNFEARQIWLDLKLNTAGTFDIDALKKGNDFIADLLLHYSAVEASDHAETIREQLKPMFESWQGRSFLDEISEEELAKILADARDLTLNHLIPPS